MSAADDPLARLRAARAALDGSDALRAPGADALEAALDRHGTDAGKMSQSLNQIINKFPQLSAAKLFFSLSLGAEGRREEALGALRALAADDRAGFECLCLAADELTALGAPEEAVAACEAALAIAPHASHAWLRRGRAFAAAGDITAAIESLRHATLLQPDLVEAQVALAGEYRAVGRLEVAVEAYRRALAVDPACEAARRGLDLALHALIPPWHVAMLNDAGRAVAFDAAIRRAVKPGMHVLDIGTGTGLLAMMAARAGAARVTACETIAPLAKTAREIIQNNKLNNIIKVIEKPSHMLDPEADMDGRADMLIAEILDAGLLSEGVLTAFADARARLLKPGAAILPRSATVHAVPVESEALYAERRVGMVAGFDLSAFNALAPRLYLQADLRRHPWRALAEPVPVFTFDFRHAAPAREKRTVPIRATAGGTAQLVVFWFSLALDDETALSTGPDAPPTHWRQAVYALDTPFPVQTGDALRLEAAHDGNAIRLSLFPGAAA